MNVIEIIEKKKKNIELSKSEIEYIVNGYISGEVYDYQMSSFLMAVVLNGMTRDEINYLTATYIDSGDVVDFHNMFDKIADKHSTGGVGDKTSLIVGPLVASCGIVMAKMSGKGLGHTGGTIDKLESVEGFKTDISEQEFIDIASKNKLCIIGQTKDIAVADKKIYALRDVTGTVDSIPLISASIMSKKLASGSNNIVLDVKVGEGAILDSYEASKELAETMVAIGHDHGKKTTAILSDMNYPLGYTVGNKLEVIEAYRFFKGEYAPDLYELCVHIASRIVSMCMDIEISEAKVLVESKLENNKALKVFEEFITLQGGDLSKLETEYSEVEVKEVVEVYSKTSGYITNINALKVANIARDLGAGRFSKDDVIDYNVGVLLHKKVNEFVNEGDLLASVFINKEDDKISEKILDCYEFDSNPNLDFKIIYTEIF